MIKFLKCQVKWKRQVQKSIIAGSGNKAAPALTLKADLRLILQLPQASFTPPASRSDHVHTTDAKHSCKLSKLNYTWHADIHMGSLTANQSFREQFLFLNMKNLPRSRPRWPHTIYLSIHPSIHPSIHLPIYLYYACMNVYVDECGGFMDHVSYILMTKICPLPQETIQPLFPLLINLVNESCYLDESDWEALLIIFIVFHHHFSSSFFIIVFSKRRWRLT